MLPFSSCFPLNSSWHPTRHTIPYFLFTSAQVAASPEPLNTSARIVKDVSISKGLAPVMVRVILAIEIELNIERKTLNSTVKNFMLRGGTRSLQMPTKNRVIVDFSPLFAKPLHMHILASLVKVHAEPKLLEELSSRQTAEIHEPCQEVFQHPTLHV